MSISNRKPATKEAPTEPFKRAVAGCMRAIASKPDLEVTFAADRPALTGDKARLPEPPRKLTPQRRRDHCAAIADSMALRLACHDAAVHRAPRAGGPGGARGLRRRRAGARRGARRAPHGRRRRQPRRHARGPLPPRRQLRGRSPTAPTRRSRTRSRSWCASASPAQAAAGGARKIVDLWRDCIEERAGERSRRPADEHRAPARLRRRACATCSPRSTWPTSSASIRTTTTSEDEQRIAEHEQQDGEGEAEQEAEGDRRRDRGRGRRPARTRGRRERSRRRAMPASCPTMPTTPIPTRPPRPGGRRRPRQRAARARLQGLHAAVRRDRSTPRISATPTS